MKITGYIDEDLNPYLNDIFLVDKNQHLIELKIVLDTGFNVELTLPEKYLNQCNFIRLGDEEYILADGSIVKEDTYQGEIVINKKPLLIKFLWIFFFNNVRYFLT
jgi:predicted aspartyl protease